MPIINSVKKLWQGKQVEPEPRKHDKFYSSTAWRKLRAKVKKIQPLCKVCKKEGKTVRMHSVDHRLPRRFWPKLSLILENMVAMCHSCHATKSTREGRCNNKQDVIDMLNKYYKDI